MIIKDATVATLSPILAEQNDRIAELETVLADANKRAAHWEHNYREEQAAHEDAKAEDAARIKELERVLEKIATAYHANKIELMNFARAALKESKP